MSKINIIFHILKVSIYFKLNPSLSYSKEFSLLSNIYCYFIHSSFFIKLLATQRHKYTFLNKFFNLRIKYSTKDNQLIYIPLKSLLPKVFPWETYNENLKIFFSKNKKKNELKNHFNQSPVIIDIGAHYGLFCCRGAYLNPSYKFYCIEPSFENFKILKKNFDSNLIKNNIKIYNAAISNKSGSETFIEGNSSTTGFLKSSNIFFDNNLQKEFVIKSFSFQDFLKQNNIDEIDILKVDIEGGEYLAFENNLDLLLRAKLIIFELHMCNNIIPEKTKLFKYINNNFKTSYYYPSKSYGNKLIEIFGKKKHD